MKEELIQLAAELEEHLKFYRDIGVEHIGGSLRRDPSTPAEATERLRPAERPKPAAEEVTQDLSYEETELETPSSSPLGLQSELSDEAALFDNSASEEETVQQGLFGDLDLGERNKQKNVKAREVSLPVVAFVDPSLEAIRLDIGDCTRCRLHEKRTNIVFGEGSPNARLMFIGEGPGADEDLTGRPFVGRAGQLLDKIIEAIGLRREDAYIANIVKCRPPGNRTPERDEVATCEPFLFRQIALIKPDVIVALGSPAYQCLLKTRETITRARGEWRDFNGIKVMPTFHPAYLLRSPDRKRDTWEDMKKVRDYLAARSA